MKDNMEKEMHEKKMQMWKMREEMLNSMDEKELRAFIKGYMLAQKMMMKKRSEECSGKCGCRNESNACSCGNVSNSCGCGNDKNCDCDK